MFMYLISWFYGKAFLRKEHCLVSLSVLEHAAHGDVAWAPSCLVSARLKHGSLAHHSPHLNCSENEIRAVGNKLTYQNDA